MDTSQFGEADTQEIILTDEVSDRYVSFSEVEEYGKIKISLVLLCFFDSADMSTLAGCFWDANVPPFFFCKNITFFSFFI